MDLYPFRRDDINITGYRLVDPSSELAARYLKKWEYMEGEEEGERRGKAHPFYVRKDQRTVTVTSKHSPYLFFVDSLRTR